MILTLFGRHLHNQIVGPLILAILVVGVLAAVVAVSLIGTVINDWIDQSARATSSAVIAHLQEHAREDVDRAKLVAAYPTLAAAVAEGDAAATSGQLVIASQALEADNVMLLDEHGAVIASTGSLGLLPGDRPLCEDA